MSHRKSWQVVVGLLLTGLVVGCTISPAATHHAAKRAATSERHGTATAGGCPKTVIRRVVGPPGSSGQDLVPGTSAYGNAKLVTILNVNGVIRPIIRVDGSMWWKLPWWRLVPGHLTLSGRRLDAPGPPLIPDVPAGYGPGGFQASGVIFPQPGCWRITGQLAGTSVTFVALVTTTPAP
jgi:hypothetical protein